MTQLEKRMAGLMFMALGVMGSFAEAHASPAADALILEGIELRRGGRDADAVPKFDEAYRLSPSPRAAAQLGLCLQAVGRWTEADRYLVEAINAKSDAWVERNREVLRDSLEQVKANVARVEVYGSPEGASVMVNGVLAGTLPLKNAVPVNAGSIDIEVTKAGFLRGYRTLQIQGQQYQKVLIRLDRDANAAVPTAPLAASVLPSSDDDPQLQAREPVSVDGENKPFHKQPWVWITAGAVAVIGTVLLIGLTSGGKDYPRPDGEGIYGQ